MIGIRWDSVIYLLTCAQTSMRSVILSLKNDSVAIEFFTIASIIPHITHRLFGQCEVNAIDVNVSRMNGQQGKWSRECSSMHKWPPGHSDSDKYSSHLRILDRVLFVVPHTILPSIRKTTLTLSSDSMALILQRKSLCRFFRPGMMNFRKTYVLWTRSDSTACRASGDHVCAHGCGFRRRNHQIYFIDDLLIPSFADPCRRSLAHSLAVGRGRRRSRQWLI